MLPDFIMSQLVASESSVLADDFEKWLAGFKFNWSKSQAETGSKTQPTPLAPSHVPKPDQLRTPPPSPRELFIASITRPLSPDFSKSTSHSSASSSHSPPPSQHTNLFRNDFFQVAPSPNKGLGAYAIQDIPEGTVIMAEKPLLRCHVGQIDYWFENLSGMEKRDYLKLACHTKLATSKVAAIFKTNRFRTIGVLDGIFLNSSRFNHACHPFANCTYFWDDQQQKLIVRSLFDIPEGTEIKISYIGYANEKAPTLVENYGFYCDCPACPDPDEVKEREKILKGEVETHTARRRC